MAPLPPTWIMLIGAGCFLLLLIGLRFFGVKPQVEGYLPPDPSEPKPEKGQDTLLQIKGLDTLAFSQFLKQYCPSRNATNFRCCPRVYPEQDGTIILTFPQRISGTELMLFIVAMQKQFSGISLQGWLQADETFGDIPAGESLYVSLSEQSGVLLAITAGNFQQDYKFDGERWIKQGGEATYISVPEALINLPEKSFTDYR